MTLCVSQSTMYTSYNATLTHRDSQRTTSSLKRTQPSSTSLSSEFSLLSSDPLTPSLSLDQGYWHGWVPLIWPGCPGCPSSHCLWSHGQHLPRWTARWVMWHSHDSHMMVMWSLGAGKGTYRAHVRHKVSQSLARYEVLCVTYSHVLWDPLYMLYPTYMYTHTTTVYLGMSGHNAIYHLPSITHREPTSGMSCKIFMSRTFWLRWSHWQRRTFRYSCHVIITWPSTDEYIVFQIWELRTD